ncbi:MAG: class I SAM-dependent methyltransferase [Pseudomonadota bacterium]
MSHAPILPDHYKPTHDEAARQDFVGALKGYLNGPLEHQLGEHYEHNIRPDFERQHGRQPTNREDGWRALGDDPLFQLWGASVYASQDLMWETVDLTCQRVLPAFEQRWSAVTKNPVGSLSLNPALALPEPIRSTEIHRQPGGYFSEAGGGLLCGLRYFGTVELYRNAKGLATGAPPGAPGIGLFVLAAVQKRFGDITPEHILDLGCGSGTETLAYKMRFPDARINGVDLSAPLLRFAHLWAEDAGLELHFKQADARDTGLPADSQDLIVSNILFHETRADIVGDILREAYRLLAPGGILLNVDTAYQPDQIPIPKQVTNDWQVINNGEPFWTGFADMNMREELLRAGFDEPTVFADYDPLGSGYFHVFGGQKKADDT